MAKIKLTTKDVKHHIKGFYVEKITKSSDGKLSKLEELLAENIASVDWANIDDLQYLCVSWTQTICVDNEQEQSILNILNKLYK